MGRQQCSSRVALRTTFGRCNEGRSTPPAARAEQAQTGAFRHETVRNRPNRPMHLRVKTLTRRVFGLDVHPTASIDELKAQLAQETGIPLAGQRLVYKGEVLQSGCVQVAQATPDVRPRRGTRGVCPRRAAICLTQLHFRA